jgi:hypothetical protein
MSTLYIACGGITIPNVLKFGITNRPDVRSRLTEHEAFNPFSCELMLAAYVEICDEERVVRAMENELKRMTSLFPRFECPVPCKFKLAPGAKPSGEWLVGEPTEELSSAFCVIAVDYLRSRTQPPEIHALVDGLDEYAREMLADLESMRAYRDALVVAESERVSLAQVELH